MAEVELDPMRPSHHPTDFLLDLSGVAEIHGVLEWLIAQPLPISRIYLNHEARSIEALELPQLPFPLMPEAGWTGFRFPASYLDYPVERAAETHLEAIPHSFLFGADEGKSFGNIADQVRRVALRALRDEQRLPSFEEIAAAAGASPATLRRRLMAQDTSYRKIKESCRRELGLKMLRHSSLSIEEIAGRLDYCDSDAFRRAFRSWMGTSPSRLRGDAHSARND
jgi:AraC-like DNA-binding protein